MPRKRETDSSTVFQIMPDRDIWTVANSESIHNEEALSSGAFILNNDCENTTHQNVPRISNTHTIVIRDLQPSSDRTSTDQVAAHSEENIADLDLSFLNDSDDVPNVTNISSTANQSSLDNTLSNQPCISVEDSEACSPISQPDLNGSLTDQNAITDTETMVIVDVSKPIQLSQNSLIIVDGKKCVLQQDTQTGQVVAYPVAEPDKPKKKRGRPRKVVSKIIVENQSADGERVASCFEDISDDDEAINEKGLHEVVNNDGALVRRSSRKRKRTRLLKDYETGNLSQEIGSDLDDTSQSMKDNCGLPRKKPRQKNASQTKKSAFLTLGAGNNELQLQEKLSRSKKCMLETEEAQSFLIQTADGQQLMIQVPLSSIPSGMSIQDVAQDIADTINFGVSHIENTSTSSDTDLSERIVDSTILSNESVTATDDSVIINNSGRSTPLPSHSDVKHLYNAINIGAEIQAKNLNLSPSNNMAGTDIEFSTPLPSEVHSSCDAIKDPKPSIQNNVGELEYALSYSHFLPDFGPQSEISKATFSSGTDGSEVVLSIPEIVIKQYESSLHSSDNFVPTYVESSTTSPHVSHENVDKVLNENVDRALNENEPATDIVISEAVVYSSSVEEEIQKLKNVNKKEDTSCEIYQNNVYASNENVDILFFQCDGQIIPLNNIKHLNTDSACVNKNTEIESSIDNDVANSEHFLQRSTAVLSTSVPTISQDNSICEESVAYNYFVDSCAHNASSNCITFANKEYAENNSNVNKIVIELSNNEIPPVKQKSKLGSRTSPVKTNKGRGRPKKRLPVTEFQSLYQSHFCKTNEINTSQDNSITPVISDENTSENCALSTTPIEACSPVPEKKFPLLLPKSSDNSDFALETYQCAKCPFYSVYEFEYQQHLNVHLELTKECKNCKFVCDEEAELIEHYKKRHPRWICTECNCIVEHPSALKQHMNTHSETGCACIVCGKAYKDQYILKMHVKLVHLPAEVLFKCHLCEKEFNRKAHLKRHLRTHGPDKPFKCSHCEYRGCEKSDITKHMLIHEEPKHECEYCGKIFRHIKNKELHIKRHKNQRDYKCGICEFFGYTFTDVRKHIEKVHTNSKFSCSECGQVFKSSKLLQKHQNSEQCEVSALEETDPSDDALVQLMHEAKGQNSAEEGVTFQLMNENEQGVSSIQTIIFSDKPTTLETPASIINGQLAIHEKIVNSENGNFIVNKINEADIITSTNCTLISHELEQVHKEKSDLVQVGKRFVKISCVPENQNSFLLNNISSEKTDDSTDKNAEEASLTNVVMFEQWPVEDVQVSSISS